MNDPVGTVLSRPAVAGKQLVLILHAPKEVLPMTQGRVLLIDDHNLFRAALKALLASESGLALTVTAEATGATEAYHCFDRGDFDVIVMDLMLSGSSGLTILHEAKRRKLPQPRLVLSAHTEVDMITESIAAGASGYVSKDRSRRRCSKRCVPSCAARCSCRPRWRPTRCGRTRADNRTVRPRRGRCSHPGSGRYSSCSFTAFRTTK